eukprot:191724-Hanusia_phi.AAC.1
MHDASRRQVESRRDALRVCPHISESGQQCARASGYNLDKSTGPSGHTPLARYQGDFSSGLVALGA